jgi:hypothetical protein
MLNLLMKLTEASINFIHACGKDTIEVNGLLFEESNHLAKAVWQLVAVSIQKVDKSTLGARGATCSLMSCTRSPDRYGFSGTSCSPV